MIFKMWDEYAETHKNFLNLDSGPRIRTICFSKLKIDLRNASTGYKQGIVNDPDRISAYFDELLRRTKCERGY